MAIRIPIISMFDSKGIDKAVKKFDQLKTSGEKAQFALEKAAIPAALALGALAVAAGKTVSKAIESQVEQDRLRQILITTNQATNDQVNALLDQANALQSVGVASAGSIIAAQAQLATFDLQFETIKKLTPAITDYVIAEKGATATAADFKNMTNGLASALNGQFASLTKAGFVLDDNTKKIISNGSESQRAAALVKVLDSTYKGFNKTARETAEGQLIALKNSFDDLQVEIGTVLIPVMKKIIDFVTDLVEVAKRNVGAIIFFGTAIGLVAAAVVAANIAIKLNIARLALMKAAAVIATAVNFALATSITAVQLATGIGIAVVVAATAALAVYVAGQKKLQSELNKSIDVAGDFNEALDEVEAKTLKMTPGLNALARQHKFESEARLASVGSLDKYNEAARQTATDTGSATKKVFEFGKAVKEGLQTALDTATTKLETAQQVFNDFATSIANGVKAGLSFAAVYQLMQSASQNAGKASEELAQAQIDLSNALKKGDVDDITKAQERLTEAQHLDAIAAKENKETFLGRLAAQVQGVKDYATNLNILLQRGLSQDALQLVIAAGGDAGAAIATELVNGTTELITGPGGINELVGAANEAANAVGLNAATNWYQAGVDQASAIVNGLNEKLKLLTPKLMKRMDKIAASLARTVDVTVKITEVVNRIVGGAPVAPKSLMGIPKLAEGGIVRRPTLALIGEAGPEAVVPLNRMNRGGGITVNVTGGLSTSAEIGQAVVNAIRAYNRSAGPANIQVA